MTTIAPPATPLPEIPYRGIESFRYIDQRVFCSREEETWDLLSNILINRGVLLYGDSGCGKSSLINAGLIPAAIQENLWSHRLRVQPRRDHEIKVERIPIESDGRPPYLPSDLHDPSSQDEKALSFDLSLKDFSEQLKKLRGRSIHEPRPLLIVDQFEEFITLFEQTSTGDGAAHQQEILNVFTSILQDEALPVKMLFVFREEYLAKLNILFKTVPELLDHYVRLLPPRVEEAETIILAPFVDEELKTRFAGNAYQRHVQELEGPLAKTIADQIRQRSENGFINLTELQIVCRKLWESPDPVKYFQSNDSSIQEVLEGYLADAVKKLGDLQQVAVALLGHMVTSTNTRNIVSEPDLQTREKDNFTAKQIIDALNALVESKLVRREPRHKIYFYEIASEFLVPWILEQKTARIAAQTKQRLRQVERERRVLFRVGIGLFLLLVVAGIAAVVAFKAYKSEREALRRQAEAQRQRDEAEKQRDELAKQIIVLGNLMNTDPQVRLQAVRDLINLDHDAKLRRELVPLIVAFLTTEKNVEISYVGQYFFNLLKDLNAIPTSRSDLSNLVIQAAAKNEVLTAGQQSTQIVPRVYFQLASDAQRGRADKIATALRQIGFTVPSYQIVSSGTRTANQLRYYEPLKQSEAEAIANSLNRALSKITEVDGPRWAADKRPPSASVRPGHFELWFATDVETPTPLPSAATPEPRVLLRLSFVDEQGNQIPIQNPTVTLEPNPFTGRQIIRSSNTVWAPPGNYILFVQAQGHQLSRTEITLQGAEMPVQVRLKPTPARGYE